jgi:hypothetical protein
MLWHYPIGWNQKKNEKLREISPNFRKIWRNIAKFPRTLILQAAYSSSSIHQKISYHEISFQPLFISNYSMNHNKVILVLSIKMDTKFVMWNFGEISQYFVKIGNLEPKPACEFLTNISMNRRRNKFSVKETLTWKSSGSYWRPKASYHALVIWHTFFVSVSLNI